MDARPETEQRRRLAGSLRPLRVVIAGGAITALLLVASAGLAVIRPRPLAGISASTGTTRRISLSSGGGEVNGASYSPAVSGDGRFVVFASDAANLVHGDTNAVRDIFVRDSRTGKTMRVSVSSSGAQANAASSPTTLDLVSGPSISADGRLVAFASDASNLVAGDSNATEDVFVRDLKTRRTWRVSVGAGGAQADAGSLQPAISADGRFVAFVSAATNLVPGASAGTNVFVRDLKTRRTTMVSVSSAGTAANSASLRPAISADGRMVAFESFATNLVAGDRNAMIDVFVRDVRAGRTQRISVSSARMQGNAGSYTGLQASFSGNDRYVVFYSLASNLVAGDTNGSFDVFMRDLKRHSTTRVSLGSHGQQANDDSFLPSISADGRLIAFESTAGNLATTSAPGTGNVYVRDRTTRQTRKLNRTSAGALNDFQQQYEHADISADGRFVAFASLAAHLVRRDRSGVEDVFIHGPLHP
jgi:Tol biopolymer transport system component